MICLDILKNQFAGHDKTPETYRHEKLAHARPSWQRFFVVSLYVNSNIHIM